MTENIEDAYPCEPWCIRIRTFYIMVVLLITFQCFFWFVSPPEVTNIKGFEEEVSPVDAPFVVYKLHKTTDPTQSFHDHVIDILQTVIHFMLYYLARYGAVVLFILLVFAYCYRFIFMRHRVQVIADFYHMDIDLISEMRIDKSQYFRIKEQQIKEELRTEKDKLFLECPPVCRDLSHPNLITSALVSVSDYICLPNVYFSPGSKKFFDFADIVVFMRQVLEAVQYLHGKNVYHLNLQPKNVWVRKSMWRYRRTVKIGGFHFAKQRLGGNTFPFREVGLQNVFRPPEYTSGTEMDAEKFDVWSIGVIAFEAFTGGMLTIESELMKPPVRNGQELLGPRGLLNQWYFLSAVQNSWDILRKFYFQHYMNSADITLLYDLYYDEVPSDCIKFVRCLLYHDYELRYTIEKALEMPLMGKATQKRKISILNPFRYL